MSFLMKVLSSSVTSMLLLLYGLYFPTQTCTNPSNTHTMFSDWVCVCVCGVTECLNYGLIVSLAGFCCCHHIGPVKVNYWNMFICCQPLPQAVTCMETQTNTHTRTLFTQTIHRAPRVPQALNIFLCSFVSASAHFVQFSVSHLKYKHTVILQFPSIQ